MYIMNLDSTDIISDVTISTVYIKDTLTSELIRITD